MSKAKIVTGEVAQEPVAKENLAVTERAKKDLKFLDYQKCNQYDIHISGDIRLVSRLDKNKKKQLLVIDMTTGKTIVGAGITKKGDDMYLLTELASHQMQEKVVEKREVVKV